MYWLGIGIKEAFMLNNYNFVYKVVLKKQDEGGYLVQFPDFPEAITQGETREEAIQMAADCLEEAVANRIVMGLDIPNGCNAGHDLIALEIILAAKCALYLTMKKNKYKNVDLAKALHCDEKEVRRLLNPRYKSKIQRLETALKLLGEKLTLSVAPMPSTRHRSQCQHGANMW